MTEKMPPQEAYRYLEGYEQARRDLRRLMAKVDEKKKLGVVRAWLHQRGENGSA